MYYKCKRYTAPTLIFANYRLLIAHLSIHFCPIDFSSLHILAVTGFSPFCSSSFEISFPYRLIVKVFTSIMKIFIFHTQHSYRKVPLVCNHANYQCKHHYRHSCHVLNIPALLKCFHKLVYVLDYFKSW